ncbi:hypothetical protein FOPG_17697 [Fusarium oxysporum f. sp. conglutinans race 2 54008]|uniref:Uncharacterized protein n=1 Tax=Fusarium oxysporum f. sp. conglutinans race 2 54008 TaxID=1089457 RepID=X0GR51_FUSOX|nr:hypothetical protein FOPG_17697 [Fusarium oxysporum f. sp. conglutinans race 2 54008]
MALCIRYVVSCRLLSPSVRRSMCRSLPPYPTERAAVAAAGQASRFLSLRQGLHQNRKRQWIEVVFSFPQELQKLSKPAGNAEGFGSASSITP